MDGISVSELGGGRCVSLLHQGPYAELGRSYARLLEYIRGEGIRGRAADTGGLCQGARG